MVCTSPCNNNRNDHVKWTWNGFSSTYLGNWSFASTVHLCFYICSDLAVAIITNKYFNRKCPGASLGNERRPRPAAQRAGELQSGADRGDWGRSALLGEVHTETGHADPRQGDVEEALVQEPVQRISSVFVSRDSSRAIVGLRLQQWTAEGRQRAGLALVSLRTELLWMSR